MQGVQDFLAMGGYAAYVWPAYGLTAAVMLGVVAQSVRRLKANQRRIKAFQDSGAGRRGRREREEASAE